MSDYKQTRDVSGRVVSRFSTMLKNLQDDYEDEIVVVSHSDTGVTTLKGELELQYDSYGIWLVEVGSNGTYQLGHIPWQTIAIYIKEYLQE